MYTRDRVMQTIEATATWTSRLDQELNEYFPQLKTAAAVISFMNRSAAEQPHASVKMEGGLLRPFLIAALSHAVRPGDSAFAQHANQHRVASEVADVLIKQMTNSPQEISTKLSLDRRGEYPIGRLVVKGGLMKRKQNLQPYIILGERLAQIMLPLSLPEKQKWQKQIFKELLVQCGAGFATLSLIRAGATSNEIITMSSQLDLQELKQKIKLPTQKRPNDIGILRKIEELLFYVDLKGNKIPIFDPPLQSQALSLAESQWGQLAAEIKQTRASSIGVVPIAIFETLTKPAIKIAQKYGRFTGAAKTNWLERTAGRVTSQIVTLYFIHQHDIKDLSGKPQVIARREFANLLTLPNAKSAADQTDL